MTLFMSRFRIKTEVNTTFRVSSGRTQPGKRHGPLNERDEELRIQFVFDSISS